MTRFVRKLGSHNLSYSVSQSVENIYLVTHSRQHVLSPQKIHVDTCFPLCLSVFWLKNTNHRNEASNTKLAMMKFRNRLTAGVPFLGNVEQTISRGDLWSDWMERDCCEFARRVINGFDNFLHVRHSTRLHNKWVVEKKTYCNGWTDEWY